MSNVRITRAYCIELDEVVTITQARRAFLQMTPIPESLNFLCSDPICREKRIRVAGVNYQKSAEDSALLRIPYFRSFPQHLEKNRHLPGCEWEIPAEQEDGYSLLPGESEEQAKHRRARAKLRDYIDHFEPQTEKDSENGEIKSAIGDPRNRENTPEKRRGDADISDTPGVTRTRDFERLVENYRDMREKLTQKEWANTQLFVKGIGRIRYNQYFRPLGFCNLQTAGRVIFGGVRANIKRYNEGFRLLFIDKVNDLPVSLYVSAEEMKSYRHQKYLQKILSVAGNAQYFTAYVLGQLELATPPHSGVVVKIASLNHLVLIPKLKPGQITPELTVQGPIA